MDLSVMDGVCDETHGIEKCCSDCKATRTPLWRAGPIGPKSLCNACGIKYRKNKRSMIASNKEQRRVKAQTSGGKCSKLGEDLRARLVALGKEVVVSQRQISPIKRQQMRTNITVKKKMGEVEQAACLLMALSCGYIFA